MSNHKKVSIVMPVYNASARLKSAVLSVQKQDWEDWELILVEDGSTDHSAEICGDLVREDPRVSAVFLSENSGAAVARNVGLSRALGRYVAFLDADDEWEMGKLSQQISFMEKNDAVFSYTGFWRKFADGRKRRVHIPPSVTRAELLKGNVVACSTALYDREHFGAQMMPKLVLRQDFAFWLKLLEMTDRAVGLDQALTTYNVGGNSLSSGRWKATKATWYMYRGHLGLNCFAAASYLSQHLLRRLLRG